MKHPENLSSSDRYYLYTMDELKFAKLESSFDAKILHFPGVQSLEAPGHSGNLQLRALAYSTALSHTAFQPDAGLIRVHIQRGSHLDIHEDIRISRFMLVPVCAKSSSTTSKNHILWIFHWAAGTSILLESLFRSHHLLYRNILVKDRTIAVGENNWMQGV